MLSTPKFLAYMGAHGFGPYVRVPCSFLKPFINFVIDSGEADYIAANNEGEAIAIACGAYLAGRNPVVMFQNSGLGNTVNPLTSLNYVFRIPLLLIATWRGEPGIKDAPQHQLMGHITPELFDLMRIPHELFPEDDSQLEPKMEKALCSLQKKRLPYAFVMRKNVVTEYELSVCNGNSPSHSCDGLELPPEPLSEELMFRRDAVMRIADGLHKQAVLIATTGKTARELSAYRDRPTNFYVVGSMGCASSLALGVALHKKDRTVVALDGDGAALMRLEAMASIGYYRPANFLHVVLDNEAYESTGGQRTLSGGINFPSMAIACGYRTAGSVNTAEGVQKLLEASSSRPGPHLIHLRIRPGSDPDLPRPSLAPPDLAERFRRAICDE